ncbi:hypothetical protein FLA_2401 [Filimonas lacunae]|nr:hypothetical protein FLA_2401 [Filimonas lacunae]
MEAGYLVQPHFNKDFKHFTGQTPGESYVVAGADKQVRKEAVTENNLKLVSNVFLRAASIEKAVELAKDCPILAYGGSVEVKEIPAVAANVAR